MARISRKTMPRKVNVKVLVWLVGTLAVSSAGVHFLHAYQVHHHAGSLFEQAERAQEGGKFREAADYLARYLAYQPADTGALVRYALLLDKLADGPGAHYRAFALLEQAVRREPDRGDLREQAAGLAIGLFRFDDAARHLEALLKTRPGQADVEYSLGWCQESMGNYAQAVSSYRQALRHGPSNLAGYQHLANLLNDRMERPQQAAQVLDDMVAANPEAAEAYLHRARYRQRIRALPEAWADLIQARRLAPNDTQVIRAGAKVALARGDLDESLNWVLRGLELHPTDAQLLSVLAELDRRWRQPTSKGEPSTAPGGLRRRLDSRPAQ
jgi:tetratricopeptide (TPR) repeat protein